MTLFHGTAVYTLLLGVKKSLLNSEDKGAFFIDDLLDDNLKLVNLFNKVYKLV